MNLISSYAIINKVVRDYGLREDKTTYIEWIGEAMEGIGIDKNWCQEAVAFIGIDNYQCPVPKYCRVIQQIARNNTYTTPFDSTELFTEINTTGFEDQPVPIDEFGQPLTGVDYAYYRPYFDYIYEYQFWYSSPLYQENYSPVRLADNRFFNSLVSEEKNVVYAADSPEYTIVPESKLLRFNFPTGQVAVSYLRQITDEFGYPMIPEDYSYQEAVATYIIYRKSKRDFYNHVQGAQATMLKAEQDWQFYCRQAKNKSMIPQTIDEYESLRRNYKHLLPADKYKTFGA